MSVIPEFLAKPGDMVVPKYDREKPPALVIDTVCHLEDVHGRDPQPRWYYVIFEKGETIRVWCGTWKRVSRNG